MPAVLLLCAVFDWSPNRTNPRFGDAALDSNLSGLAPFYDLAKEKGCTAAQLALAWVRSH